MYRYYTEKCPKYFKLYLLATIVQVKYLTTTLTLTLTRGYKKIKQYK